MAIPPRKCFPGFWHQSRSRLNGQKIFTAYVTQQVISLLGKNLVVQTLEIKNIRGKMSIQYNLKEFLEGTLQDVDQDTYTEFEKGDWY